MRNRSEFDQVGFSRQMRSDMRKVTKTQREIGRGEKVAGGNGKIDKTLS